MKLLCFGEIVWDEIGGQMYIGGGPFNVAAHARILGADEVFLLSAVGGDELGAKTREAIRASGVADEFVKTVDSDTCVVRATLDGRGNATFAIPDPTSFDLIEVGDDEASRIREMGFDCLYFGTIAQRRPLTRSSLRRLVERGGFRHVMCDVNLRMNFYDRDVLDWSLRHSDIVKLNEDEAAVVQELFGIEQRGRRPFCERLRRDFGVRWVCLTGGERGAWISWPDGFEHCPATQVEVADTIGSGDAFAAAIVGKLTGDGSPADACAFACRVGGLVASRRGAVPEYALSEVGG